MQKLTRRFLQKCSHPLWKNLEFFVYLPFKKNEDINPTKASHKGMNPDHYALAIKEVDQLQQEGLIENTKSQWACEAFYVNKRSEQIRGKLRLVINYQPLNHFLEDDKFPLPKREVLFQKLPHAKVFSKFDLTVRILAIGNPSRRKVKDMFLYSGKTLSLDGGTIWSETSSVIVSESYVKDIPTYHG